MTSADPYAHRSPRYGWHVRTYRDAVLGLQMLQGLQLARRMAVLDLGSGQGDSSTHLRAAGGTVVHADRSLAMLRAGVKRGTIDRRTAVACDLARGLPFADGMFDIISIRYALHDISDKAALFREMCRVATDSALVQITDMCVNGSDSLEFYNHLHSWKTRAAPERCWIEDEASYERLLDRAGIDVVSKSWYRSVVSSRQWLKEGQITARRHNDLVGMVRAEVGQRVGVADAFQFELHKASFVAAFPVIVLTGQVRSGGS